MEIVTFLLVVNVVVIIGITAVLAYALRLWPLHDRPRAAEDPDPRRVRRGAWFALAFCVLIAGYSSWVCVRIEHYNEQSGGFLPTEYYPKGWRWCLTNELSYRLEHQILEKRPLTQSEQEHYARWTTKGESLNALHRTVEEALRLYVLIPLALTWIATLAAGRGVPVLVRMLSLPAALCLIACGYVLVSRGVYTALMGD